MMLSYGLCSKRIIPFSGEDFVFQFFIEIGWNAREFSFFAHMNCLIAALKGQKKAFENNKIIAIAFAMWQ